jgi:hypothetical protein
MEARQHERRDEMTLGYEWLDDDDLDSINYLGIRRTAEQREADLQAAKDRLKAMKEAEERQERKDLAKIAFIFCPAMFIAGAFGLVSGPFGFVVGVIFIFIAVCVGSVSLLGLVTSTCRLIATKSFKNRHS